MTRGWRIGVFVLSVLALGLWGYDRAWTELWIGATELKVEFVVTDAETGQHVGGAEINLRDEGRLTDERPEATWTSTTDAAGITLRSVDAVCTGRQSGLKITDTYSVRCPWWYYRVKAPGYELLNWTPLQGDEQRRRAERVGPRASRLVVPIAIRKRASGQ